MNFTQLGISSVVSDELQCQGIVELTPIQALAIPKIMQKHDVLLRSQTGGGKSLAYLLPIIELLRSESIAAPALILLPTRELAQQVAGVCESLLAVAGLSVAVVHGGVEYESQVEALQTKPSFIVATPGRLIDILEQKMVELPSVECFVLDEVDQMLDMGFHDSIMTLAQQRSTDALNICVSATMTDNISATIESLSPNIESVEVENERMAVERIDQSGFFVEKKMFDPLLIHVLRQEQPQRAILFTRSKMMADRLQALLVENSMSAEAIHSDRSQAAREHILARFKGSETKILVATDLMARGIDVEGVTHVINYGLPQQPEDYIHRIGRTARAGSSGKAITVCAPEDKPLLDKTCKMMQQHIVMSLNHPYITTQVRSVLDSLQMPSSAKKTKQKSKGNKRQRKF